MLTAQRSPFVERAAELSTLVDAVARNHGLVVVEGPAGIGKSRLIREAMSAPELDGSQVLLGEARPTRDANALGPVADALRGLEIPSPDDLSAVTGALRTLLPNQAHVLPPAPDRLSDPDAERHRVLRAILELLHHVAPVVLVLEDVHWADNRTIDLLGMLERRRAEEVAVVISYRGTDMSSGHVLRGLLGELRRPDVARIELQPLSTAGVGEFAAGLLGAEVSDELRQWLTKRSGGLPFVVEHDVRSLRERGMLVEGAEGWHHDVDQPLAVPQAVGDAVVERAERLSPVARAALNAVAVLAGPAREELVAKVAGLSDADAIAGLSEALSSGLLCERGEAVAFSHALARDAVYHTIPARRRRELHLAAARAVEAGGCSGVLGSLAHHYGEAGKTREWVLYAEAAGDAAAALGDDETALRLYSNLLDSDALPEDRRTEITRKLAWAAPMNSPETSRAIIDRLSEALTRPGVTTAQRAQLRVMRGWHRLIDPDTAMDGFADLRSAVRDLGDRPADQARALATLAAPWAPDTPLRENQAYLHAARAAAARTDDPGVHAHVATNALWLLVASGDRRAREELDRLAADEWAPGVSRQQLRGLSIAADCLIDLGHYRLAEATVERALRLSGELEYDRFRPFLERVRLRTRWSMGRIDDVETELERLRADGRTAALTLDLIHGELLLGRGELDEAYLTLDRVYQRQLEQGAVAQAAHAAAGVLRLAAVRDGQRHAARVAKQVLDAVARSEIWLRAAPILPFAPLAVVHEVIETFRVATADRDVPLAAAALAFANGRIAENTGDHRAAIRAFAQAGRHYAALPDPRHVAHATEAEARNQLAVANSAAADERYRRAWRIFTSLRSSWDAERMSRTMREAGLSQPRRGGRRSYGQELSPREREVAHLAATGHSNAQIAHALFLSQRTVESHIAKVLRKLDITSRHQIEDALPSLATADESPDHASA